MLYIHFLLSCRNLYYYCYLNGSGMNPDATIAGASVSYPVFRVPDVDVPDSLNRHHQLL